MPLSSICEKCWKLHLDERDPSVSASRASELSAKDTANFEAESASSARKITSHDFGSRGFSTATEVVGSSFPKDGNLKQNQAIDVDPENGMMGNNAQGQNTFFSFFP